MKVEQVLEQMDRNIKVLRESVEDVLTLPKYKVKEMYGTLKTYNECVNYERGALDSMINFRQWIVNRCPDIKHLETYEQLLERSFRKD